MQLMLLALLLLFSCTQPEESSSRAGYFLLSSQGTLWQRAPGDDAFSLQGSVSSTPQVLAGNDQLQLFTCPTGINCLALLNQVSLGFDCLYSIPVVNNPHRALAWVPPDQIWWLTADGLGLGGVDLTNGLPVATFSTAIPELSALTGVIASETILDDIVLQSGDLLGVTVTAGQQASLYIIRPDEGTAELVGMIPAMAPLTLLPEGSLIGCATENDYFLEVDLHDLSVDTLSFRQPVINPAALCWLE